MDKRTAVRTRVALPAQENITSRLPGKLNIVKPVRNPLNEVQNKTNSKLAEAKKNPVLLKPSAPTIGLLKPSVAKVPIKPLASSTLISGITCRKPIRDENTKPALLPRPVGNPTKPTALVKCKQPLSVVPGNLKPTGTLKTTAPVTSLLKPSVLKSLNKETKGINPIVPVLKDIKKTKETNEKLQAEKILPVTVPARFRVDPEDDPLLLTEYATDTFRYLKTIEVRYAIPKDHIKNTLVTPGMRSVLVDWMAEACNSLKMVKETLHMSVALVDRYLSKNKKIDKNTLQLVGVVAMFISSKYEEVHLPSLEDWLYICDYAATRKQLLQMEIDMLKRLEFNLTQPTAIGFLRRYHKVVAASMEQHELGKYMIDLALIDYSMSSYPPSLHAAAACCLARFLFEDDKKELEDAWCELLEFHADYTYGEIRNLLVKYVVMITNAATSKYQTIRTIYASSKYRCISKHDVLKSSKLMNLARKVRSAN